MLPRRSLYSSHVISPDADAIAAVVFQAVVGGQVHVEILEHRFRRARRDQLVQNSLFKNSRISDAAKSFLFCASKAPSPTHSEAMHFTQLRRLNDREGDPADRDFLFRHKAVFVSVILKSPFFLRAVFPLDQ